LIFKYYNLPMKVALCQQHRRTKKKRY